MATNIYTKLLEVKKVGITLQRDTDGHNYKYATLSQIQSKLSEVMQEQKLLVFHRIEDNHVVTEIRNTEADELVESRIAMHEGTKAQDKGSEITYYRRYNLLSLLDLEVEDDDGKKAQGNSTPKVKQEVYVLKEKDIEIWEGKIYWKSIYLNWEKKTISEEQITKLKSHAKYVELPPKK